MSVFTEVSAVKLSLLPYKDLKSHEVPVQAALYFLILWYNHDVQPVDKRKFETYLRILVNLFQYTPYSGPLFRVFPVSSSVAHRLTEGKTYKIKTGMSKIQSWTTSASNALVYALTWVDALGDKNYAVVKLESKGYELTNSEWLTSVCQVLSNTRYKDLLFYESARKLLGTLTRLKYEDEVILKVPSVNRAKVIILKRATGVPVRHVN